MGCWENVGCPRWPKWFCMCNGGGDFDEGFTSRKFCKLLHNSHSDRHAATDLAECTPYPSKGDGLGTDGLTKCLQHQYSGPELWKSAVGQGQYSASREPCANFQGANGTHSRLQEAATPVPCSPWSLESAGSLDDIGQQSFTTCLAAQHVGEAIVARVENETTSLTLCSCCNKHECGLCESELQSLSGDLHHSETTALVPVGLAHLQSNTSAASQQEHQQNIAD